MSLDCSTELLKTLLCDNTMAHLCVLGVFINVLPEKVSVTLICPSSETLDDVAVRRGNYAFMVSRK